MSVDRPDPDQQASSWDGYSDYRSNSERVARTVHDAVTSYAMIEALHSEEAKVPDTDAAEAKRHILAAATMLKSEVECSRRSGNAIDKARENWSGENSRLDQLRRTRLGLECPTWLGEFVGRLRSVAWELGYVRAGRWDDSDETVAGKVDSVFNGV